MKYMGSKARIAKEILPILLAAKKPEQVYAEPFCGGCNMIDKLSGFRIANDGNSNLIAMWRMLMWGWKPEKFTKEQYIDIRENKEKYPAHIVGWVGFNCSYSGKYFGGFAGETKTKIGTVRDYQDEAIRNVLAQVENLKEVMFIAGDYRKMKWELSDKSALIYCDPPYEDTTKYTSEFNHAEFWNWVREMKEAGHTVFVSEYQAPSDFTCVWQKTVKSSLSANGKVGGSKESVERLFTL